MATIGITNFEFAQKTLDGVSQQLELAGLAERAVLKTSQNRTFERVLGHVIALLKDAQTAQNTFLCFGIEKQCIFFEKDFFATTEQDHKRLDKQLSENGAAVFSAKLIFESEKYKQHILDIYGPHRKIMFPPAGEPCVTITRKQIQQLARPKTGITSPKIKEFYAARQENLRCALGLCIEAQCKALDIPVPKQGKAKGLEL